MSALLKDKVAVVTGAAQGIGEFIARAFCHEGASVFMGDRDACRLQATAQELMDQGYVVDSQSFDVTDRQHVKEAMAAAKERFGRIDVLVNNAGAYPRRHFLEMSDRDWDQIVDINLNGTFNCTRAVAPILVEQKQGAIINIGSVTFFLGMANLTHYVAAKGGVVGFTRSLARDLGSHNIRVHCISPGAVATESEKNFGTPEEIAAAVLPLQSLKRRIVPADIARVAVFLASDLAAGMTGQTLNVDGGWVMY